MVKGLLFLLIGMALGGIVSYFASTEMINGQRETIAILESENRFLLDQINSLNKRSTIAAEQPGQVKRLEDTAEQRSAQEIPLTDDTSLELEDSVSMMLANADEALNAGDTEAAFRLYNLALSTSARDQDQREAKDGLVDVHEEHVKNLVYEGQYLHMALWELFEIHKLSPSSAVSERIGQMSSDVIARVPDLLDSDQLLMAADHLSILFHTNNMMNSNTIYQDGQAVSLDQIQQDLKRVQTKDTFLPRLKQRAGEFLVSPDPFLRSVAFWDYAKVSELDSNILVDNTDFRESFAQATVQHLNHLKENNQYGEIRSRMDYIRYVFPSLMEDERIYHFQ